MPIRALRDATALAITCTVEGIERPQPLAARLCEYAADEARRGAPIPVSTAHDASPTPHTAVLRLTAAALADGQLRVEAQLADEDAAGAPRPRFRQPPTARVDDEPALRRAVAAALAVTLPWRSRPGAQVPTPPRS